MVDYIPRQDKSGDNFVIADDFSGVNGGTGRTYTLYYPNSISQGLAVYVQGAALQYGLDYTYSSGVITFINSILDSFEIVINYFVTSTSTETTPAYTSIEYVSDELGGMTLSAATIPSSTTVERWISEASAEIDRRTGKTWAQTSAIDELLDFNGSRYLKLPHVPVLSVSSLQWETNGLGADATAWSTLSEGRNEDFILYPGDGEIMFTGRTTIPSAGRQNCKITYTYGYTTTPPYITRLATVLVALRVINATINSIASEEGGSVTVGNISITDPSTFSVSHVKELRAEINDIYSRILGESRVYRPKRVYYE